MAKGNPNELDTIKLCIEEFGEKGGSFSMIQQSISIEIHERTLHRRLEKLISEGEVLKKGRGRATKYYPIDLGSREPTDDNLDGYYSEDALAVYQRIIEPVQARAPVTYQRELLDNYIVNETFYLPEETRCYLNKIGQVDDGNRQPAGTYAAHILDRLLIDLSFNSSRLEGNTYSLLDTKRLVASGVTADGKAVEETQMILNHKEAIQYLVGDASTIGIDPVTIKNLHALLSDNLLGDPSESGRLRDCAVEIGRSTYTPLAIPQVISECFEEVLLKATKITDPFEQSLFLLIHIPYLQPFVDVNKRVSRLAANIPFICENLRPLSFVDVPEKDYVSSLMAVYELNETALISEVFAWAYERSAQKYEAVRDSLGQPDEFRLTYRQAIKEVVATIITEKIPSSETDDFISMKAKEAVAAADSARFHSVINTELIGLHEGNYARYRVTYQQFKDWSQSN